MNLEVNKRVRGYRRMRNYSQEHVAKRLNMKLSTYSQMEKKGKIACELLIKISEILEVSVNTLLYGDDLPESRYTPQVEDLTSGEKTILTIIKNLPNKAKDAIYEFVNQRSENIKI